MAHLLHYVERASEIYVIVVFKSEGRKEGEREEHVYMIYSFYRASACGECVWTEYVRQR